MAQATDYYPFGKSFEHVNVAQNRYLYNGKELQDQAIGGTPFGWYDYGARFYDPEIARWHSVDPLAEKYFSISPYAYCAGNPIVFFDSNGEKIVFVNGFLGFGSPQGGAVYWGGNNSEFVKGAHAYFKDSNTPYFTNFDYDYLASSTPQRIKDGYAYAKANYAELIKGMDFKKDVFNFVSHSMGGAFSDGMINYLKEQGWRVDNSVYIDTWLPGEIPLTYNRVPFKKTEIVDATVTNDPVQFLSLTIETVRDIQNSDKKIRKHSQLGFAYRHRDFIDSGKDLWNRMSSSNDNYQKRQSWNNAMRTVSSWLQQNPNIKVTVY